MNILKRIASSFLAVASSATEKAVMVVDSIGERAAEETPRINTPLGKMTTAQYAAYVKSLTPEPFHLSRPEGFVKRPSGGNKAKWDSYFEAYPVQVAGSRSMIRNGQEAELRAVVGSEFVKQVKRVINENFDIHTEAVAA